MRTVNVYDFFWRGLNWGGVKKKARAKSAKSRRLEQVGDGPLGPVYKTKGGAYLIGEPPTTKKRIQSVADLWLQAPGRPPGGRFPDKGGRADDYIDPSIERELVPAADADAHRRHRAQQQQGIDNCKTTRRKNAREERLAVDKMKAESDEKLTDEIACRRILQKKDPEWKTTSYEKQRQNVKAMAQRVSNQRRRDRLENKG
jgi:hypothetical protein